MKQKGFTLIELMITIIFSIVVLTLVIGIASVGGIPSEQTISYGINGLAETRCIEGMKFVVGQSGSVQQILGPNGGGVACQ